MKYWHARVRIEKDDYGRWVPTGCSDLDDAKYYIRVYYQTTGQVVEWLQL